jgi:hypothetical protein
MLSFRKLKGILVSRRLTLIEFDLKNQIILFCLKGLEKKKIMSYLFFFVKEIPFGEGNLFCNELNNLYL